ncbi:MAG: radical SAM protein [Candidatus Thermoplasmatota archaeon]|nr:radical SAM protein [Candidatus Thermoplasmatota archaeon]
MNGYLQELEDCELCEWRCGVNRLEGEKGVCMLGRPKVASTTLHPAPPQSYTVFMAGCNYRCLNCQNWTIAHHPEQDPSIRGYVDPKVLAEEAVNKIKSKRGKAIGADRIFFSGGSPIPSLPYIEKVVEEARKLDTDIKVNYDTNGYLTETSLRRVLGFTTSITFDIKAYRDEVHRALTGAPVQPVLRNARYVAKNAKEKLWEFRFLLIPKINEKDVEPLAKFLVEIDEDLPLNFLAFRPNFVLEEHKGATRAMMERAVKTAKKAGLKDVSWSGRTGISGKIPKKMLEKYEKKGAKLGGMIAKKNGCVTHPRDCGNCSEYASCSIKRYRPTSRT